MSTIPLLFFGSMIFVWLLSAVAELSEGLFGRIETDEKLDDFEATSWQDAAQSLMERFADWRLEVKERFSNSEGDISEPGRSFHPLQSSRKAVAEAEPEVHPDMKKMFATEAPEDMPLRFGRAFGADLRTEPTKTAASEKKEGVVSKEAEPSNKEQPVIDMRTAPREVVAKATAAEPESSVTPPQEPVIEVVLAADGKKNVAKKQQEDELIMALAAFEEPDAVPELGKIKLSGARLTETKKPSVEIKVELAAAGQMATKTEPVKNEPAKPEIKVEETEPVEIKVEPAKPKIEIEEPERVRIDVGSHQPDIKIEEPKPVEIKVELARHEIKTEKPLPTEIRIEPVKPEGRENKPIEIKVGTPKDIFPVLETKPVESLRPEEVKLAEMLRVELAKPAKPEPEPIKVAATKEEPASVLDKTIAESEESKVEAEAPVDVTKTVTSVKPVEESDKIEEEFTPDSNVTTFPQSAMLHRVEAEEPSSEEDAFARFGKHLIDENKKQTDPHDVVTQFSTVSRQDGEQKSDEERSADGRSILARLAEVSRMSEDNVMPVWNEKPGDDKQRGKLVVFMHVTGGAGATTMAVNTAYALNEAGGQRRSSCLIDLDLQFGGVASLLDLPYSSAMQALIEDPGRLDRTPFEEMLVRHPTGLQVLTAPRFPVPLHVLKQATITELLRAAKSRFSHVVVDMPVALATWTDVVLSSATQIYLVTPTTVPAAHRVARLLSLLQSQDLVRIPLKIIVNRYNSSAKTGAISPKQFTKAINRPIDHLFPNEYELVLQSQNQGTPAIRIAPQSRYAQAVYKLLSEDIGETPMVNQQQRKFALFDRS
jgi:Flp pilus assembly CpaE family ATPase